jgi:hypothetical protein
VAVAVNLATNQVYVADSASNGVAVVYSVPWSASSSGNAGSGPVRFADAVLAPFFGTTNNSPSFNVTATSDYTPSAPPPTAVYYQLDTAQGAWSSATGQSRAGANPAIYCVTVSSVPYAVHFLYVYAAYGHEGTPDGSSKGTGTSGLFVLSSYGRARRYRTPGPASSPCSSSPMCRSC